MKTVHGLDSGRKALLGNRRTDLSDLPPHVQARTERVFGESLTPVEAVDRILRQVREGGDAAVRDLTQKLDGVAIDGLAVDPAAIAEAYSSVPQEVVEALKVAAERIRRFHEASLPKSWMDFGEGYGELVSPVGRVGIYIPGGTARYPSTVLMTAVPARVAGVDEMIVSTATAEGGQPHPELLVAADIAGVDRVFCISGAQAVAAMAFGTETVPRVDLICGPGNIFVTLAKKAVFGEVGIDGLYGPTETMIVADDTANSTFCAADLVAQAEHDELATPVLITTSAEVASAVAREVDVRLERLERSAIAGAALLSRGCIVVLDRLEEALELANELGPEHLSLMVEDPWRYLGRVRNAGAVFLGDFSHEVLGDYVAGPSHVMPTGGTARFSSGVNVRSFLKFSPVVGLDQSRAADLAKYASILGRAEGLTGHAEAAEIREEFFS